MTTLVQSGQSHEDDIEALRARVSELEAALVERAAELTRVKSDLAAFRISYGEQVGLLHEELDELERAIAEAELGELSKRVENEAAGASASAVDPRPEPPRYTSDAVRRLFRDVAKTIHPNLARDESTRDRRHTLMAEANRAYALGDEDRLRWVLQAWASSPESVPDGDPDATRLRLARRLAQIDNELNLCARDLEGLKDSPLWQLKAMVDEAAERGKDLVGEMVRRLNRDIMAARNRLDAMLWQP